MFRPLAQIMKEQFVGKDELLLRDITINKDS